MSTFVGFERFSVNVEINQNFDDTIENYSHLIQINSRISNRLSVGCGVSFRWDETCGHYSVNDVAESDIEL